MSDRRDSSPSRILQTPFNAQAALDMDQFFDFTGPLIGLDADWSPFGPNGALDILGTGPGADALVLTTTDHSTSLTVAPGVDTSTMAMTQLPEVALTGNAENSTWTVNPTQLQGVGVAGNTFDNMTAFPSDQFVDGFAMASEGHSSFFSTTQMGYMRTPFAWNETATNQSVSVPSQLHYPPLVEGSSAAFAGAA